ncbi:hypothetical protein EV188_10175 [Actinomycetospora succinea]|uniref:Uncharacterized protein n=1 Tax=Actinomycetospora succinea TaxID=663603 RepID=A0A4V3DB15_9PSEU|nr:hypothetical protein [Actinomycetospora succinea]TDQ64828.1 hypothetical protein EV188_10175 [Actinomycetospora succinea]
MSVRRRPSRAQAEDLLDGGGSGPLRDLLAAASGPAHREEVVGEDAATRAFVAAHGAAVTLGSVAPPADGAATRRARWRTPTGLASALALALAGAGVAVGTVAVALHDGAPTAPPASSVTAPPPAGAGGPGYLPDPVRVATCRAWGAAAPTRDTDPAFAALVAAAGGAGNVDRFCAAASSPGVEPTSAPTAGPTAPASSTTRTSPGAQDAPRSGSAPDADTASPSRAPGASRDDGSNGTGGNGRAVGPPTAPPGQAGRNGRAEGRSVGPPAVPPGQDRANGRSPSRGAG